MTFHEVNRNPDSDPPLASRWILAASRKDALKVAERLYPGMNTYDVGRPEASSPRYNYWWRMRRFHRPETRGLFGAALPGKAADD
jgi:hypothetical protein